MAADREKYSNQIKELYTKHGFSFKTISGDYVSRFEQAIKLVDELLEVHTRFGD